jgi:fatty-acyl-CoA synthase
MSEIYFTPLTPLAFLDRSADVFPDKIAIVHGERRLTYREFAAEATRVARALQASGVQPGDRVAYLAPNIPELLVAHFAVPLAGAVLVALNTRLSPEEVRFICDDSGAVLLVADTELLEPLDLVLDDLKTVREVVAVHDSQGPAAVQMSAQLTVSTYTDLLARGSDEPLSWAVEDESATISINYTSGTTGQPKGVMYSHRGAYLNSLGEILHAAHTPESVYLWTLPMFHCNGWCMTWAVTGIGGRHVCLRSVRADTIWRLLEQEKVTHLCGAPTVLVTIAAAPQAHELDRPLVVTVAGAPPSPTIIARMTELGARTVHVYGLTETYGPYALNERQESWADLPADQCARLQARQGVGMVQAERMRVVDEEMVDVPRDAATLGEIVMRGNNLMKGYFADPDATADAFRGGWFHSGDLGVMHPDGYVELRDRAKDIVISGGENISTVEVEQAILSHPAVLEVAVIGVPDDTWGERPKAFVVLRPAAQVSESELLEHVRTQIARYKCPSAVEFIIALPMTSTGKIQKVALRDKEWADHTSRIKG